ncbi:MAG: hypothetical protein U1E46_01390 [Hyphomicrobiales bacterium]
MTRGELLLLAGAGAAVAATAWWAISTTMAIDTHMSWHGVIALALGIGFSLLLGVGLMNLVYRSNRSGHDDAAHDVEKDTRDIRPPRG